MNRKWINNLSYLLVVCLMNLFVQSVCIENTHSEKSEDNASNTVNFIGTENDIEYDASIQLKHTPLYTPTPVLIAAQGNPTPTPTITPIPHPSFEDCMHDCLLLSYPNGEFPTDVCFTAAAQGGILAACGLTCLPLGPAWPGCVGGCYAIGLATCMGVGVVEMTATATGCATGCW